MDPCSSTARRSAPRELAWFVAVSLLLLTTAALKLHAVFSRSVTLVGREKVFDLDLRGWSIGAAAAELIVVAIIALAARPPVAFAAIRFAFGAILVYRVLLYFQGGGYCGCLGSLLARSPLQEKEGLLLGGVAFAVYVGNEALWWLRRRGAAPRDSGGASLAITSTNLLK